MYSQEDFYFCLPNIFGSPFKEIILANSIKNLFGKELKNKYLKEIDINLFVDTGLNIIGKKAKKRILSTTISGITLTNNKINDIIKVIKSLENTGILSKGTTTKITSQEGGDLNFLRPIITAALLLMKT